MILKVFVGLMTTVWLSLGFAQYQSLDSASSALQQEAQQSDVVQLMESVIQTSAAVEVARADIFRAEATANMLRVGPYEFQVELSAGRREVTDPVFGGEQYDEWAGGVSRTVRLPGKRGTDQQLAEIEVELAKAIYEKSLYDERLAFIQRWSTWSSAQHLAEITTTQVQEMATLAELEQRAVDQGSGRQVNADQLKAESDLAALQAAQDELTLLAAQAELETYYPNIRLPNISENSSSLAARVGELLLSGIARLPEQYVAEISSEKAGLLAERARQDRVADPTLGLAFTDEFGGQESSITAQISIPIGGSSRRASSEEAQAQLRMSEIELSAANRTAAQQVSVIEQMARIALQSITGAAGAADTSSRALAQFQQGYEMGAITLSDLIAARRSHYLVERALIEQHAKHEQALLSYLALSYSQLEHNYF